MRVGKRHGSGRPAGTPNRATEAHKARICDLAKDYAEAALEALVSIARNGASEAARVSAACAILDRAYGKPQAQKTVEVDHEPIVFRWER